MTEDKGQGSEEVQAEGKTSAEREALVERQAKAQDFFGPLFLSPSQMAAVTQYDSEMAANIRLGNTTGKTMLQMARDIVGITGHAEFRTVHQEPADLANSLFEIRPMAEEPIQAATAEELAAIPAREPVIAAFANIHESENSEGIQTRNARVVLIRQGANGKQQADFPKGERGDRYKAEALKQTQPPLSGPSWGAGSQ